MQIAVSFTYKVFIILVEGFVDKHDLDEICDIYHAVFISAELYYAYMSNFEHDDNFLCIKEELLYLIFAFSSVSLKVQVLF